MNRVWDSIEVEDVWLVVEKELVEPNICVVNQPKGQALAEKKQRAKCCANGQIAGKARNCPWTP
jgi:hypothetical protein